MNAIKTYKVANKKKFQVQFGAQRGGKWQFQIGRFTLLTKVRGGQKVAKKIADVLRASWFRCEDLDAEAREQIQALLQVRTLADYQPDAVGKGFAGMVVRGQLPTVEAE